jgi:hypothetical protein
MSALSVMLGIGVRTIIYASNAVGRRSRLIQGRRRTRHREPGQNVIWKLKSGADAQVRLVRLEGDFWHCISGTDITWTHKVHVSALHELSWCVECHGYIVGIDYLCQKCRSAST